MKSVVPFQLSLFRNLVVGPLLVGGTLLVVSLASTGRLREHFAAEMTGRIIAETETAFLEYLRPVQEVVDLSLLLGVEGRFATDLAGELDPFFGALLETVHQLNAVHHAKGTGEAYMLLRNSDGTYFNRLYDPATPGLIQTRAWLGKPSSDSEPVVNRVPSDYDPTKREWFSRAVAALRTAESEGRVESSLVWSDPYPFFTTKEPGITASVAYRNKDNEVEVLAFDILLSDILEFAQTSQSRHSGIVFILLRHPRQDDLKVLALPSERLTGSKSASPTDFPIPVDRLSGVPQKMIGTAFFGAPPEEGEVHRFDVDGKTWWGGAALSPLSVEREIWTVAALQQSQLLAGIPEPTVVVLVVMILTVVLMLLWARWLARRYGDPLGDLVAQTERMSRLNFSRELAIESPIHEIQALALSQDVMRRSLSTLSEMNEREAIAHEWRSLPRSEAGPWQVEKWQVALWDAPSPGRGGNVATAWPVNYRDGLWRLAEEESEVDGMIFVSTVSALQGLGAAQWAATLRGGIQALMRQGSTPGLMASVAGHFEQVKECVVACFDARTGDLSLTGVANWRLLHWRSRDRAMRWIVPDGGAECEEAAGAAVHLPLDPGDRVILAMEPLFDVLNRQRERFPSSELEKLLQDESISQASEMTSVLLRWIRAFSERESLDEDIVAFVIVHPEEC